MSVPSCDEHDGDCMDIEDCPKCIAWMDAEEAYHGGLYRAAAPSRAAEKFYGELGIDITKTDPETMDALRRLK